MFESHTREQFTKRGYYRKNAAGDKHNAQIDTEELIVETKVGDQNTVIKTKVWDLNTAHKGNHTLHNKKTPGKQNPEEVEAVKEKNHPGKLEEAVKDTNNPVKLKKAVMGNAGSTGDNKGAHALESPHPEQGRALHEAREGGHALKSLPPGVQGGALHGAKDGWGGHALLGPRPDDKVHQGASLPHHQDVGHIPTNDVKTVHVRAEEKFAVTAVKLCYVKSIAEEKHR